MRQRRRRQINRVARGYRLLIDTDPDGHGFTATCNCGALVQRSRGCITKFAMQYAVEIARNNFRQHCQRKHAQEETHQGR